MKNTQRCFKNYFSKYSDNAFLKYVNCNRNIKMCKMFIKYDKMYFVFVDFLLLFKYLLVKIIGEGDGWRLSSILASSLSFFEKSRQLPCQPHRPDRWTGSQGKVRLFRAKCLICWSTSDMFQKLEEIMFKGPTLRRKNSNSSLNKDLSCVWTPHMAKPMTKCVLSTPFCGHKLLWNLFQTSGQTPVEEVSSSLWVSLSIQSHSHVGKVVMSSDSKLSTLSDLLSIHRTLSTLG